jgi:O-antigen ligase
VIFVVRLIAITSLPILVYAVRQFFVLSEVDYAIIESNTAAMNTWMLFGKVRAFGIFNGPFHLGLYSGIVFWIALGLYVETKRNFYIAVAAAAVLACLASLTRSSIIALSASFPIVLFYTFRRHWVRAIWITILAGLIAFVSIQVLRNKYEELDLLYETVLSFRRMAEDTRLVSRYEGYERSFAAVKSNPFGLGMGSAADAMEYYFEPHNKIHITSHNLFLRIVLETGWLGLLLFLAILGQMLACVRSLERSGDSVAALMLLGPLAIVLITGISGSTIGAYPINLLFRSLCGLLVGYSRIAKGELTHVQAG